MLKLVVPGQGIKPILTLPLTTAMPSQHATFQQLWKKLAKKIKIFKNCFLPIFFWKSKLLNLKKVSKMKQFRNFLFFSWSSISSTCLSVLLFQPISNHAIPQSNKHMFGSETRKKGRTGNIELPFSAVPPTNENLFLRHYFWGHLVQCWEKVFNIILEYKYQTCFIQILSNDAGLFESGAA